MGYFNFMHHKPWEPTNRENQQALFDAEQKHANEKQKIELYKKEKMKEAEIDRIRQMNFSNGLITVQNDTKVEEVDQGEFVPEAFQADSIEGWLEQKKQAKERELEIAREEHQAKKDKAAAKIKRNEAKEALKNGTAGLAIKQEGERAAGAAGKAEEEDEDEDTDGDVEASEAEEEVPAVELDSEEELEKEREATQDQLKAFFKRKFKDIKKEGKKKSKKKKKRRRKDKKKSKSKDKDKKSKKSKKSKRSKRDRSSSPESSSSSSSSS